MSLSRLPLDGPTEQIDEDSCRMEIWLWSIIETVLDVVGSSTSIRPSNRHRQRGLARGPSPRSIIIHQRNHVEHSCVRDFCFCLCFRLTLYLPDVSLPCHVVHRMLQFWFIDIVQSPRNPRNRTPVGVTFVRFFTNPKMSKLITWKGSESRLVSQ